jgi:hypothetical protein
MNTPLQSFNFLPASVAPVVLAMLAALAPAHAQQLPPLATLPGDTQRAPATQVQERPDVAPGGEGYLVVWHDARSALKPLTNNIGSGPDFTTLGGNMRDVYAARLDADGNLIDTTPIILSNDGYNQARPRVAWNGQHWLVVWLDDQDDYDTNIVGVRVAPDGTVLDDPPILIRQQANNSGPGDPVIASDGNNWLVVWPEFVDLVRGLRGARVASDGAVLDNPPKILRLDSYNSYADAADVDFANARYVVTWIEDSGELDAQRFATNLTPIDAAPIKINGAVAPYSVAKFPSVSSNGSTTLFAWWEDRYFGFSQAFAARMVANGTVLDPAGIELTPYADYTNFQPEVTWDGSRWFVSFNKDTDGFNGDLFVTRVAADGSVLDFGGVPVSTGPDIAIESALTPRPGGGVQIAWTEWIAADADIRAAQVGADGQPGAIEQVSIGLPQQSQLRFASTGEEHLAVYLSKTSDTVRLLAQRLDASGNALDAEPIVVHAAPLGFISRPDIAWNGERFLVVWQTSDNLGTIEGKRLAADGTPIDAEPLTLLLEHEMPAVAALDDTFLVAGSHQINFHEPVRYIQTVRVRASDGAVLDPVPALVGVGFALDPRIVALGGRWLVAWEAQAQHDHTPSTIDASFVTADNIPLGAFDVSVSGYGDDPDITLAGDEALIVWSDDVDYLNASIEGRLLRADGSFATGEFLIADAANDQFVPQAAWDGAQYMVTWIDYRNVPYLGQLRGDVYAARVDAAGVVLDPGGFPLTGDALPEDYVDVAAFGGQSVLAFSSLHAAGVVPEVQRIGVIAIGEVAPDADNDGVPDSVDNCTIVANADQRDTNGDGYGNLCDPDLNNDGTVNFVDLGMMKSVFFTADPDADLDGNGSVSFADLGILKAFFFLPPGPSGLVQ